MPTGRRVRSSHADGFRPSRIAHAVEPQDNTADPGPQPVVAFKPSVANPAPPLRGMAAAGGVGFQSHRSDQKMARAAAPLLRCRPATRQSPPRCINIAPMHKISPHLIESWATPLRLAAVRRASPPNAGPNQLARIVRSCGRKAARVPAGPHCNAVWWLVRERRPVR